ncbi:hypothetical protein ACEPAH_8548 [Sanghuangporus vaninii]
MSPILTGASASFDNVAVAEEEWTFKEIWYTFTDWVSRASTSVNNETLEHPYLISLALFILWAWPHILMLPVWFGKDAYRRMDTHARTAVSRATAPVRRRKRDGFFSTYHSVVNASYEPREAGHTPLFGGTPLTDGDFSIEEEHHLPVALRVIRWTALAWAVFILGRELYFVLSRY